MIDEICINSTLLAGASEVFETMIFMDLDQCLDPEESLEGDVLLGSITFRGNIDGCLVIRCSFACARAIATNMLGMDIDEEISKEDIYDALGEVTNMVMGSIKTQIQQTIKDLHVSIPIVTSGRIIETNLGDGSAERTLIKVTINGEYIAEFSLLYKEGSE